MTPWKRQSYTTHYMQLHGKNER